MFRSKKAQSTLEYLVVFSVIVAAIVAASQGLIKRKVTNIVDHATDQAESAVEHINFK